MDKKKIQATAGITAIAVGSFIAGITFDPGEFSTPKHESKDLRLTELRMALAELAKPVPHSTFVPLHGPVTVDNPGNVTPRHSAITTPEILNAVSAVNTVTAEQPSDTSKIGMPIVNGNFSSLPKINFGTVKRVMTDWNDTKAFHYQPADYFPIIVGPILPTPPVPPVTPPSPPPVTPPGQPPAQPPSQPPVTPPSQPPDQNPPVVGPPPPDQNPPPVGPVQPPGCVVDCIPQPPPPPPPCEVSCGPVLPPGGSVPEPATWALMIGGFGLAGAVLRRRPSGPKL